MELYNTQDVRNWGISLSEDENSPDQEALRMMLRPLESIEIDLLLPEETEAWCTTQLQAMGFFEAEIDDPSRPFISFYLSLRQRVQDHQESRGLPSLQLLPNPTGGAQHFVSIKVICVRL
jgi:hypothetical protein